jgi:hypothetical protein
MPVKSKIVGAVMALPVPGNGVLAVLALALVTRTFGRTAAP